MKKITTICLLLISTISISQTSKVDSLIVEFRKDSFYGNVYPAKLELENYQKEIIPKLISLLNDTSFVKLTGTADLIYPGAENYYGHGHYVPYALDWISVRSGWLLEELTFQNFGFATSNSHDLVWVNEPTKKFIAEFRRTQAEKAKIWWRQNKKNWRRIDALKEALQSNDVRRVSEAAQFLRFGETKCDGLDRKDFFDEIKPLIQNLIDSRDKDLREIGLLLQG